MADGKGGSFTKVVQKHAGRAKERILQNLGRADKTKDEVFEVYLYNFSRQQNAAIKLQKEFKNYVMCIKGLQLASKALMDTLSEIYEQEWVGHEQIPVKAQTIELLWDDYHRKMNDQVMVPLNSYISQFNDVRGKIAKRGRKLVDYDKSRHTVESLRNSAKKRDDYKLGKAREELEQAKQMYEVINNELHDELPALYDSRIPFLVSNLQTFFSAEGVFHGENSKVFCFLAETMQKLAVESEKSGSSRFTSPTTLANATGSPRSYGLPNFRMLFRPRKGLATGPSSALVYNNGAPAGRYSPHTTTTAAAAHQDAATSPANAVRRTQSDRERRRSRSVERLADDAEGQPYHEETGARRFDDGQKPLQRSGMLSRYSEQHLPYYDRRRLEPKLTSTTRSHIRSYSTQHLPATEARRAAGDFEFVVPSRASPLGIGAEGEAILPPPPRRRSSASRTKAAYENELGLLTARCPSPERFAAGRGGVQYARVRRYSEQTPGADRYQDGRPTSSVEYQNASKYRYSVDRLSGAESADAFGERYRGVGSSGPVASSSSGTPLPFAVAGTGSSRPVELYLVVRPPEKGPTAVKSEAAVQTGGRASDFRERLYGNVGDETLPPASSVSREAETRPYEEIEFRKGKGDREHNRNSDISIKVTETNGQVTTPLVASPVRSAARLENEESAVLNTPGYRGSYAGDQNGEPPVARKREEKEYEPVEVGAQMNNEQHADRNLEDLYDIPVGATTTDLPPGVLYRVRATYKYTAEDVDELNFESGEIIRVVEYDDPEEQEEGWLMGIKESTGEKGLFPANFTRPI